MRHTRSQCANCNQVFAGTRAFDAHRVGPSTRKQRKRRCLTRKEMLLRGMTQNEQGWWMLPARSVKKESVKNALLSHTGE